MPNQTWTVHLMSHDGQRVRKFSVSYFTAFLTLICLTTLLITISLFTIESYLKTRNYLALVSQEAQNWLLVKNVETVDRKIGKLQDEFSHLLSANQTFRLVAGLDELDQDVLQAGVGGLAPHYSEDLLEINSDLALTLYRQEKKVDELLRQSGFVKRSLQDAMVRVEKVSEEWRHLPSITPTTGYISSGFGRRLHPIFRTMHYHSGLDFSTGKGQPIHATADGKIVVSGQQEGLGLCIVIDHGFGLQTVYGHCSKSIVRPGQEIKRGDLIGYVGRSGITTGPHLHYEVHIDGQPTNPYNYLLDLFPYKM
ncbi:MAG: M23 family metallopeptidase [Candidatus Glassbacteria bacterium]